MNEPGAKAAGLTPRIDWRALGREIPWLVLLLALLNGVWALRAAEARQAPMRPPESGNIRLLHRLDVAAFTAIQRDAGVAPGQEIAATCELFGPFPDAESPRRVAERVSARIAGVGLVSERHLSPRGFWVVVGPFATPGGRQAAAQRLRRRGIFGFVPAQRGWQELLVLGSAETESDAREVQARLLANDVVTRVMTTGDLERRWWLRVLRWEGPNPTPEIMTSAVFSDGSPLAKKSCKSIAKPTEFD